MSFLEKKVFCHKCGETRTLDKCLDAGEPLCGIAEGFSSVAYGFLSVKKSKREKAYICYTCGNVWFE